MLVALSVEERKAVAAYINRRGSGTHYMFINGVEAGWLAARDYYRADSEATVRMLADALKGLVEGAEYDSCQECGGNGYVVLGHPGLEDYGVEPEREDCEACYGSGLRLDALNEPVQTQEQAS